MFKTKLANVNTYVIVADKLLLQYIVKEYKHDPNHTLFVHFILIALTATLVHAVPNKQMCELFRELNMVR